MTATPNYPKRRQLTQEEKFDLAKSNLDLKCSALLDDLARSGLSGRRLDESELAHYYAACINAHWAEKSPLQLENLLAVDSPLRPVRLRDVDLSAPAPTPDETQTQQTTALTTTGAGSAPAAAVASEADLPPLAETTTLPTATAPAAPSPASAPARRLWPWARSRSAKKKHEQRNKRQAEHMALCELLQPSHIELHDQFVKVHRDVTEYFRGRAIIGYPSTVVAGWLDVIIQLDEPYTDVLLYLETLDPAAYTRRLSHKLTGYQATQAIDAKHGRVEDPWIAAARDEVEELRESIVRQEEKVHAMSLYVCARASSLEDLRARDEKIVSALRGMDLESVELSIEHLAAWTCVLPDNVDVLRRKKTFDTSTVVTAFPFASMSLSTEPGALVGVMPNGSLLILDPTSSQLENGHEVKFARSGAGKSYDEKVRLARYLSLGMHAVVIDPEDEYLPLCKEYEGVNVRLASGRLQLNPFELPLVTHEQDQEERNVLEEKIQSLLVLFDLLMAEKNPGTLSQKEKSFLTRVLFRTYAEVGISADPSTHTRPAPNMHDFHRILSSGECGRDDYELGDRLARHLAAFPNENTIGLDNPLIVFNIRDLADDLRAVGLFLIADFTWTQIRRFKHPTARFLIIDEAWTLLQFPEGGRFLASMARRGRKYNLCLRVITQDVEDFLSSQSGQVILKNASMKFLMKQDATTIDAVTRAFRLSDGERKYLLSCQRGEGLFFCGNSHVPLRIVASELEHQLATTNPRELLEREMARVAREQQAQERAARQDAVAVEQRHNEYTVLLPRFYQPGESDQ